MRYQGFLAIPARLPSMRSGTRGCKSLGMDVREATDILWFYLGYAGFFTLVDDNGWSYSKAEKWLLAAVSQALLAPPQ